ncbi:hypothetical protein AC579_7284 [Pseudocercospora musae]|uniref:Uncharacterized protein n=1 Tax=Pseudocercospora musae TaxID=113226 RepID=A0A139GVS3_9PEZI|nr:hypothetical protein AC579_7284 [Pseudocercospora musae]
MQQQPSYAIAATSGFTDAGLTLEANLAGVRRVSTIVDKAGLPLTADMQDGYEDIAANIKKAIEAGAVGHSHFCCAVTEARRGFVLM